MALPTTSAGSLQNRGDRCRILSGMPPCAWGCSFGRVRFGCLWFASRESRARHKRAHGDGENKGKKGKGFGWHVFDGQSEIIADQRRFSPEMDQKHDSYTPAGKLGFRKTGSGAGKRLTHATGVTAFPCFVGVLRSAPHICQTWPVIASWNPNGDRPAKRPSE